MAAPAMAAVPQLMIALPHSIKRAAVTFSLPSWLCSHPTPVWTGRDFSACFEDMVFGCATNLVTVILITFYSINGPQNLRQEAKLAFQSFGFKRSLGLELLPAVAIFITVLQVFQLFLFKVEKMGLSMHSWSYFGTQLIAWVATCRILYCRYEIVMTKYRLLHLWWLFRTFFYIPILRTMISSSKVVLSPAIIEELLMFVFSLIFSILVFLNRRENTWSSNGCEYKELESVTEYLLRDDPRYGNMKEVSMGESLWEVLLFGWVTPLMDSGTTRQLTYEDLFKLPRELEPKICSKKLCQTWMEEQKLPMHRRSLFHAIYCTYGWCYLGIGFVKVLNDTLGFCGPLLLNAIVYNIEDGSQRSLHLGYWCALLMGVVSALRAFLGTQYTFLVSKLKLQLRASIISLIYRKALCVSLSERSLFSSGEIQTLMSVDSERTVNLCASFHELWSLPLQMAAALSLLYMQVKFAFLAGLLVILLLIPVNKLIASRISTASQLMMAAKDERVRKIGEILMSIRTIKMCSWEDFFLKKVSESRQLEVKHLGVRKYLDAWCVYFWATTPILFSFFTFGLYSLLGHKLDAATVFTSLALFNMLISPLNSFPWVINGLIEASVSLNRLRKFLSCPEIDSSWIVEVDAGKICKDFQVSLENEVKSMSVVIQGADFAWAHFLQEKPSPVLKNVSISIPCGSVTLVFGEVAAGKSSLLQAVLGEMRCLRGNFSCQGSLGYVSQNPWIQSGTIRENILLGKIYERERYISVLDACALDVDIERMAGKDLCVVGEHGFNLSGGQRARLALARALYQDSDILLLDDPLSSLDPHVCAWILKHAIRATLKSNKTIILATHNAQALTVADMVVFMEDGLVQWAGSVSEFNNHFLSKDTQNFIRGKGLIDHYLYASKDDLSTNSDLNPRKEDTELSFGKEEVSLGCHEGPPPLVEEETRVQGAVRAAVYWIYASFIGCGWLGAILLSTFFMQISRNGSDFWLSVWVDETSSNTNFHSTHFYLTVFLWIAIANSFFTAARAFSFAYGGLAAAFKVHEALLMRVISAPIYFFEHNPKGRLLNRFSSDQYAVDDSLPFISNILLANFFSLLGIFCILCMVQWTFLLLIVPLSFFYLSLQKYYRSTSRELRRLDSTSRSPVYSSFTEALDGSPTIRAFKLQSMFSATNEDLIAVNQRTSYSEIAASLWLSIRLQLLAACIIFFISIMAFLGHNKRSPDKSVSAGLVGLGLSYASPIISLLSDLLSTFTETEKEMVSVERIQEYMDIQREESEVASEPKLDWPQQGSIYFDQVTLLYGPLLPPALKEISFNIEGGSQVGIAGRTGSGKSSIFNALFRLTKPTSGCIFIDGVDTANIPLLQLRSNLAIVPQIPFLFEGTLRDNMDPYGKVTDFDIWDALNKCHLKEIATLGGGLGMHVMESGEGFSVGQRQLLCLARCLLHHTKVLCLDECTANVDPQTANLVQETIASECKGITVITIAHRMSSILNLDYVLLLDRGELVEEGNPRYLLRDSSSKFSSFVNAIHVQQ